MGKANNDHSTLLRTSATQPLERERERERERLVFAETTMGKQI